MRSKGLSNNISHNLYGGHIALCPYTLCNKFPPNASSVLHILLRRVDWVEERYVIQQNNKNRWVTLRSNPTYTVS
jgi:hypothetical protein